MPSPSFFRCWIVNCRAAQENRWHQLHPCVLVLDGAIEMESKCNPEITRKAWATARWMAADLYWQEIDALRAELSLTNASAALRERVGDVSEPYRILLRQVRDRLDRTRDWAPVSWRASFPRFDLDIYTSVDQIWEPLQLCYDSS